MFTLSRSRNEAAWARRPELSPPPDRVATPIREPAAGRHPAEGKRRKVPLALLIQQTPGPVEFDL
jgi:hypothetical protein